MHSPILDIEQFFYFSLEYATNSTGMDNKVI